MPFDWKEYLNLSQFLRGEAEVSFCQEAAFRSAVSRAYYAAFCGARNYARDQHGFRPKYDTPDHRDLREHFRRRQAFQGIASKLDQLRRWRNNCDYDDVVPSLPPMVSSAIRKAEQVLGVVA